MMRGVDGRKMRTRVKGRPALVKSLGALLVRVTRFGQHRARTPDDRQWAAAVADAVAQALAVARAPEEPAPRGRLRLEDIAEVVSEGTDTAALSVGDAAQEAAHPRGSVSSVSHGAVPKRFSAAQLLRARYQLWLLTFPPPDGAPQDDALWEPVFVLEVWRELFAPLALADNRDGLRAAIADQAAHLGTSSAWVLAAHEADLMWDLILIGAGKLIEPFETDLQPRQLIATYLAADFDAGLESVCAGWRVLASANRAPVGAREGTSSARTH